MIKNVIAEGNSTSNLPLLVIHGSILTDCVWLQAGSTSLLSFGRQAQVSSISNLQMLVIH